MPGGRRVLLGVYVSVCELVIGPEGEESSLGYRSLYVSESSES